MKCYLGISNFLEEISSLSSLFYCFPLFICIDHWGRLSYVFLLVFGTLHSDGYIFPFLLCLSLFLFSQPFVSLPQTTILPFCISSSWEWFWSLPCGTSGKEPAFQCRRHETQVWSLGWEDPLEKEMATHSSILVWQIPWTEEPGGL